MAIRALLVMDPQHRSAAISDLRKHDVELSEAADLRTARQLLCAGPQFEMVIADVTLPDGTWCSVLWDLLAVGVNARLLVCADRHDQLMCADVVARGGYFAVPPPHEWKPLRQMISPARKTRTQAATRRAGEAAAKYAVA